VPDLFAAILGATRRIVEVRRRREPISALARRVERAAESARPAGSSTAARPFGDALRARDRVNVIAECKRRSPSRGVLRADYDPVSIARAYAAAGAAAISILTEPTFFDGSLEDLRAVRASIDRPLLRKDFIVSEYQLLEARAAGADAVLLIAAALPPTELAVLVSTAESLGLEPLVEVHGEAELESALTAGAKIIGVNNRNLRTLEVDTAMSDRLIAAVPADVIPVSESGLRSADDLLRLHGLGYRAFLIGERLMTEPSPGAALGDLLDACTARFGSR
jgi:indole-3-glycerol phosphate synthase